MDTNTKESEDNKKISEYIGNEVVLALDIEMSGATRTKRYIHSSASVGTKRKHDSDIIGTKMKHDGDVIGIGGVIMTLGGDGNMNIIDELFVPMYFKGKKLHDELYSSQWEKRTWSEFWNTKDNLPVLSQLMYKGELSVTEREKEAMQLLVDFQIKAEKIASKNKSNLVIVSDNVSYDIGTLDSMRRDYLPQYKPFVYKISDGKYNGGPKSVSCSASGSISVIESLWSINKGDQEKYNSFNNEEKMQYLFNVPPVMMEEKNEDGKVVMTEAKHSHHPTSDAATIGARRLVYIGIKNGIYTLDESKLVHK